ncbi:DUF4349 domain-containing protein [Microbacterium aurantiacum]|uniref:DUF4349 domain-containing protein n=1 Tax=Microbacterium aurantiacum TaxID=162393 RepID=UPI000C7F906C|nr:DUF4349 domain-containing protein [Microbacterium aurantiacum]
MNDQTPTETLPPLSDAAIDRIENAVFAEIANEHPSARPAIDRSRIRRRRWLTGGGIAAAFVVGVLVTPPILGIVGSGTSATTADGWSMTTEGGGGAQDLSADNAPSSVTDTSAEATEIAPLATDQASSREIIVNAQATLRVKDIAKAAAAISALAEEHGGYVESTDIGKSLATVDTSMPAPPEGGYGWISIRVPSADLTDAIDALQETGDVLSSSISKQDVTSTAIDLRARVEATRTSVQRLTELMSQSGSVSELIEAEVALTDRQAQLESYEQQLAALEDQVAMSSIQVQLTETTAPTKADPAGFGDGLLAGWNGLVVSLNALVIALGFVLPWLAVAGIVALVIWVIRRARRRRRIATVASDEA